MCYTIYHKYKLQYYFNYSLHFTKSDSRKYKKILALSLILNDKYHKLPLILTGDFNVNFADTNKSQPLLQFLKENFNLTIDNNPLQSTRYGTTLDAVFSRFLDNLESKTFISYYSYYKPIVSSISLENRQSITIEPVYENNVDAIYI